MRQGLCGVSPLKRRWADVARASRAEFTPRLMPPVTLGHLHVSLAAIGHADDDRVRTPDECCAEPLGGRVVEQALPPAASYVLGDDHERDRSLLVLWPALVDDVEVGQQRADERTEGRLGDDERHA